MIIASHQITLRKVFAYIRERFRDMRWGHKGANVRVISPMRIVGKHRIFLDDDVYILNDARLEAEPGFDSSLHIGRGTSIQQGCHIIAAGHLDIGEDCVFSAWVYVADCNHTYNQGRIADAPLVVKPTKIGNNVFIGIGAKIMPGVVIGDRAVIGANAVVTTSVPGGEIWAGVPAKKIKDNV